MTNISLIQKVLWYHR